MESEISKNIYRDTRIQLCSINHKHNVGKIEWQVCHKPQAVEPYAGVSRGRRIRIGVDIYANLLQKTRIFQGLSASQNCMANNGVISCRNPGSRA